MDKDGSLWFHPEKHVRISPDRYFKVMEMDAPTQTIPRRDDMTSVNSDGETIHPTRLLRYAESLGALVVELRSMSSPLQVDCFASLVQQRLDEADDVLPPVLAGELHRLVGPLAAGRETDRDLKVILAQLDGWTAGLVAQIGILAPSPEND